MTDEQDIDIALLKQRLETQEETVKTLEATVQELRDGKLRIEGGKWVLWTLGSIIIGAAVIWGAFSKSSPLQLLLHG